MAAKVSPVEAIKYTDAMQTKKKQRSTRGAKLHQMAFANLGRNKKKTVLVVVSLALSVTLFNALCAFCLLYTSSAKMFGTYFPPEFSITEGNAWMSTLNNSVQYISVIRPGEKVAKLVKRMHYVSFVGMFRSDLFEGLCVGHAPKKCKICGKWFLTTNARHTKYCGGYAPGDKLHRTCRQIGNLKGREQRELADDHPLKQIYEKRLNTINRYVKRGTLDADLAEVMKKLAKDKMLRAKSDVAYAKGAYEKEMEQVALKKEAYNK